MFWQTVVKLRRVAALVALAMVVTVVAGTALAASEVPKAAAIPGGALVLGIVQWLLGAAIKKWEKAYNFVIGYVVLALSLVGYSVVPTEATAASLFMGLGAVKTLGVGLASVLQTAVVTGVHEWLLGCVVKPLAGRMSRGTSYLGAAS